MLSDKAISALIDIRNSILRIEDFLAGMTFHDFEGSALHIYAVTRALEIVSEASRRLPDDLLARHPHLPWRAIRDAGNLYRHSYDNVATSYIWRTARIELAPLLAMIAAELAEPEST